jgi:hypothetical protein
MATDISKTALASTMVFFHCGSYRKSAASRASSSGVFLGSLQKKLVDIYSFYASYSLTFVP